jgi:hypothetical protein
VRINPDKQLLILSGESVARRSAPVPVALLPPVSSSLSKSFASSVYLPVTRGSSHKVANEYARTQDLSLDDRKTFIVDIYA